MKTLLTSIKIRCTTLRQVRLIAALTGEKHYAVLERLVQQEITRVLPGMVLAPHEPTRPTEEVMHA